jgi:hypothetical protein
MGIDERRPSVDDLRARLRELGYLDAGVDRFVVGPVRGGQGLLGVAWRSSVRIGLLAALLLGPSAAIALGVRLPGFVTGARDGVVLAFYLGALFGLGVTGLALLSTLLLGLLASRARGDAVQRIGPRLARTAGAIVTTASLAYLVLWWRTVNPAGTVWNAAGWTWLVLALSTAISMLLGHSVMVATLAFAARRASEAAPSLRLPRSWLPTLGLAAVAFVAAAGTLFLATRGEDRATERSGATPLPASPAAPLAGVRLTVVAVDGFDLPFFERLAASNRVPRLARLLAGARLVMPASDAPDPARTWTSLATGQGAEVHGVSGIEARTVSGMEGTVPTAESGLSGALAAATDLIRLTRPTLTTGLQRRSKTFWEVSSGFGLGTAVVNWWATWPAPNDAGAVLTDRATLRLERGGELDAEIAPPSLYAAFREVWPALRDEARRNVVEAFRGVDEAEGAVMRRAAEQDALAAALASRVFAPDADLCTVYLPGLDIAQHNLLGPTGGTGLPASALAARLESLERYYEYLDAAVAPLVERAPADRVFALLADPGRSASRGPGLLALTGGPIRPSARLAGTGADVAPTLLYLLGVPVSRELPGTVQLGLFDDAFRSRNPVRRVESYGRRFIAPRPPAASPLDRDMLERLRSLGYVR